MNKSNIIEPITLETLNTNLRYCKNCKASLIMVNGQYGKFYICSNHPKYDSREKL